MTREEEILNDQNLSCYVDKKRGWINEAFLDGVLWADSRPCETFIKWQTGEPKEEGTYLAVYEIDEYRNDVITLIRSRSKWMNFFFGEVDKKRVTAWCKFSDIEPYKEE